MEQGRKGVCHKGDMAVTFWDVAGTIEEKNPNKGAEDVC